MKKQNTLLTKDMLEEMGFVTVEWDEELDNWRIIRNWFRNNSKTIKDYRTVQIVDAVCKHKYTRDKRYPVVSFYYKGKPQSFPLARFVFAWFNGEVKDGQVIDHIDNNPFNNKLENLQALTQQENLAKRFVDDPYTNRNQWDAIKKDKMIKKYYEAQAELVDAFDDLMKHGVKQKESIDKIDNIINYIKNC